MPKRPSTPASPAGKPLSYRPSAFYFRQALREANDADALREIGMKAVGELERLKAWVRDQGLIPPRFQALRTEAADKWSGSVHPVAPKPEAEPG